MLRILVSETIQLVAENEQRLGEIFAINFAATAGEKPGVRRKF
jgi:hypothetical protein